MRSAGAKLIKVGENKYRIRINYLKQRFSMTMYLNEMTAKTILNQIQTEIALRTFTIEKYRYRKPVRFKEISLNWLSSIADRDMHTIANYTHSLHCHIFPEWEKKYIHELVDINIAKLIEIFKEQNLCKATIRNIITPLRGIFRYARKMGYIVSNPFDTADLDLKTARVKLKYEPYNNEEIDQYMEAAGELYPEINVMLYLDYYTGIRMSELIGLKRSSFNLTEGYVLVTHQIYRGVLKETKNRRKRKIPLAKNLIELLNGYFDEREHGYYNTNGQIPRDYIAFTEHNGRLMQRGYIDYRHRRIVKAAGLRYVNFHYLRHSFASLLASKGTPIVEIQNLLGHKSLRTTMDTYVQFIQNKESSDTVERLNIPVQDNANESLLPGMKENLKSNIIKRLRED